MTASNSDASFARRPFYPAGFWMILVVALVIRLVLIVTSGRVDHSPNAHPADYSDCQTHIRFGMFFAEDMKPTIAGLESRDRLFPLLLGAVFKWTGRSVLAAQLSGMICALLGLFALYPLARILLSQRASLIVCAAWVFDPSFVGQSCLPLTENLATTLIVASLWLIVLAVRRDSTMLVLGAALMLALACQARSSTYMLGPAVALWMLFRSVRWQRRMVHAITVVVILVAGWFTSSYASYRLFGVFVPNINTYRLWDYSAAKLMAQNGEAESISEATQMREQQVRSTLPEDASLADYLEAKRAEDIDYVRRHLRQQMRNHIRALIATTVMPDRWSVPSLLGVHSEGGLWQMNTELIEIAGTAVRRWPPLVLVFVAAHMLYTAVLWVGAALAMPAMIRSKERAVVWLLALTLGAVIAAGAIHVRATPRYRLPGVPMMALLAGVGYSRGWAYLGRLKSRTGSE